MYLPDTGHSHSRRTLAGYSADTDTVAGLAVSHMPHAVCVLVCALLTSNLFMAFYQFYFHSSLGSGILLFFFDPSTIRFGPVSTHLTATNWALLLACWRIL